MGAYRHWSIHFCVCIVWISTCSAYNLHLARYTILMGHCKQASLLFGP